jgi:maltose alpha-D-glucosyltransferase/alpha-amylase
VELDLSKHQNMIPVEVFGRNHFPPISDQPYFLSLGPYGFHWFHLQAKEVSLDLLSAGTAKEEIPALAAEVSEEVFAYGSGRGVVRFLPKVLRTRPWFLGRYRNLRDIAINDMVRLPDTSAYLLLTDIEYSDGDPDTYLIALSLAGGERAQTVVHDNPESVLATVSGMPEESTVVYGSVFDREFSNSLLGAIIRRKKYKADYGDLQGGHTKAFRKDWTRTRTTLEPQRMQSDQPNSFIRYGENFVLKLYRRLEAGANPDREMLEFLTEHTQFSNAPRALGWIEYRKSFDEGDVRTTLGTLMSYTRNGMNGWAYMLDHLGLFFERALAIAADDPRLKELRPAGDLFTVSALPVPPIMLELLGTKVESVRTLGQRTAEMHAALSSRLDIPEFAPEPFTDFYRLGVYHGIMGHMGRTFDALRNRLMRMGGPAQEEIRSLVAQEHLLRGELHPLRDERIVSTRIRHHGDFHLSHVQFTGNDVVITDFDGPAHRPMSERRIKRSAMRDVACMIRSFHYVSYAVLFGQVPGIVAAPESKTHLQEWAEAWRTWVSAIFLRSYLDTAGKGEFVPESQRQRRILMRAYLIDKCLMEINHELEYRPDWVRIPVRGILDQLKQTEQN